MKGVSFEIIFQMNSKLLKPLTNSKKKPLIPYYLNVLLKRWKTIILKIYKCINTSNHPFWRAIWVKLSDSILKNFQESWRWLILNIAQTRNVIKPRNTLYWEEYLLTADTYKSPIKKLQKNTVNGVLLITINRLISLLIQYMYFTAEK